jgi:hypothetical protein
MMLSRSFDRPLLSPTTCQEPHGDPQRVLHGFPGRLPHSQTIHSPLRYSSPPSANRKQKTEPPQSFGSPAILVRKQSESRTRWLCSPLYREGCLCRDSATEKTKPATDRSRLHHWLLAAQVPRVGRRFIASTPMTNGIKCMSILFPLYSKRARKASVSLAYTVKVRLRSPYDTGSLRVSRLSLRRSRR